MLFIDGLNTIIIHTSNNGRDGMIDSRIGSVSFVALEAGANVPVGGDGGGFLLAYTPTAQGLSSILAAQHRTQTHRRTDAQMHSSASAQAHRFAIYLYVPYSQ